MYDNNYSKLTTKWVDACRDGSPLHIVDLNDWMSRLTLDAIGEGEETYRSIVFSYFSITPQVRFPMTSGPWARLQVNS